MNDIAIRAEGLSKRYRIGTATPYKALRDTIMEFVSGLFQARTSAIPARRSGSSVQAPGNVIWALRGVSFEIKRGEVVGVIGRNGAGKSTVLKILSRITEPTEGRAEIHGRVRSLLEVGTGFHPELTGRENIYLNGAILGMERAQIERRFDEIVAFAEVEKFLDTPVKHYSSGMYVRLAFAVAAHLEPEILLVDEVLAVGDAAFQRKCLEKIEGVRSEGRTVLFVSHNMTAVTSLCQRGMLLAEGRLVLDDTVDRVVARYLSMVRDYQIPVDGMIPLGEHPGRRKRAEGLVRLTHCRLLDGHQHPVTFFHSGEEARFVIGYELVSSIENAELVFALTFNDIQQRRLFHCSNDVVGYGVRSPGRVGQVQCVIPQLPLLPGYYTVNVACKVGPVWSDGIYEAVQFEVVAGDFYRSGRLPPEGMGNLLVHHSWTMGSQ